MAALTTERKTQRLPTKGPGGFRNFPVEEAVKCFEGAMAALNSAGYVQPATTATGLKIVGVFAETVDNTDGADGDVSVEVRDDGAFGFENSAGADEISTDDIGAIAYAVDDQTVALTNGGSTRSEAGKIRDVKNGQVFIEFED